MVPARSNFDVSPRYRPRGGSVESPISRWFAEIPGLSLLFLSIPPTPSTCKLVDTRFPLLAKRTIGKKGIFSRCHAHFETIRKLAQGTIARTCLFQVMLSDEKKSRRWLSSVTCVHWRVETRFLYFKIFYGIRGNFMLIYYSCFYLKLLGSCRFQVFMKYDKYQWSSWC